MAYSLVSYDTLTCLLMKIEKISNNTEIGLNSKSNVSVKEMDNITEVRYSLNNVGGFIKKIDKDYYYDIRTGEVKQFKHTDNRKQNKESVSRSLRNLRDIINTNIIDYKKVLWITLTYKENMTDSKRLYNDFRKFHMRLKRYIKKNNLPNYEYINVGEPQRRGAWHLHILLIFSKTAPFIKKTILERIWGFGFVSINKLKQIDNVGVYLTAYLSNYCLDQDEAELNTNKKSIIKGARLRMYPPGFKIYRCSKGIKKPIKYDCIEEDIQEKLSNDILTYQKTIQLVKEDGKIINKLNYRHYNKIKKVKANK